LLFFIFGPNFYQMSKADAFTEKLMAAMTEMGTVKTFSKREVLLREGEIERHVYFIESGALRLSLLSEYEDQSIRLGYPGSLIVSLSSYLNGTPSEFSLEAIRKSTVRMISKEVVEEIVYRDRESMIGYIGMLESLVTEQIEREVDLLTVSPVERVRRVTARSPHIFQHIPLKYIASCFRMTAETLSRIRNS